MCTWACSHVTAAVGHLAGKREPPSQHAPVERTGLGPKVTRAGRVQRRAAALRIENESTRGASAAHPEAGS
jgi:hypothetical protein